MGYVVSSCGMGLGCDGSYYMEIGIVVLVCASYSVGKLGCSHHEHLRLTFIHTLDLSCSAVPNSPFQNHWHQTFGQGLQVRSSGNNPTSHGG